GTPMRSRGRALSVSQEADGHQSSKPRSPPADRSGERKVRRGQWSIDGTLDLHGHTQASADSALRAFLHFHSAMGARCVLVITGKGRQGEGILRRRFLDWLETHEARALSSGYAPAHRKHGGGGAWYVFLRRPATQR
ncbi:MAG: Smr/MutS family protein, partial [Pseudomonadota bacterium]